MTQLTLDNPVFITYVVTASLMILKVMGQGWMTVYQMMTRQTGLASPEDLRPGPLNPRPNPSQLDLDDAVDRSRRMHRNDLENIPAFWIAGLLFVLVEPTPWIAHVLLSLFVLARLAHFAAYATKQSHEMRATFYTIGSAIVIGMATYTLLVVLGR